jgi:hypothetical protein
VIVQYLELPPRKSRLEVWALVRFVPKVGGNRHPAPFDAYVLGALALGLILAWPLYARGLPQAPDAVLHFYRAVVWRSAWDAGVVWPRWHTALYQGYGYPLFNFYGPLLYAATAALSYLTPSVETAFKGILLLTCLAYPTGMYVLARGIMRRPAALVAAAAYAFAAYRFRELYFLGGYAQFLSWSLYPWILFFFTCLAIRRTRGCFIGAVATLAALLLTHNISAAMFAPVLALVAGGLALAYRRQRPWLVILAALLCGVGLAAIFWLPALAEARLVRVEALTRGTWDVANNFIHAWELAAPVLPLDERAVLPLMPFTFGPLHLALAGIGALALLRPGLARRPRVWGGLAAIMLIMFVFMMLPASLPVWRAVPGISLIEYPWRLYGPALLCSSLLIGLALTWLDELPRLQWAAALVAVLSLVLAVAAYQFPRPFLSLPATLPGYLSFETSFRSMGTTAAGEYLSRWTSTVPDRPALAGDGSRTALLEPGPGQSGTVLTVGPESLLMEVQQDRPGPMTLAQFDFPGWTAHVDGAPVAIAPAPESGAIQLDLPAGRHQISLAFGDTPIRRAGELLSLVALLAAGWLVVRWPRRASAQAEARGPNLAGGGLAQASPAVHREHVPHPAFVVKERQGLALAAALLALLGALSLWIGPHTSLFRYRSAPDTTPARQKMQDATFGDQVALLGYDLDQRDVTEGDELHVRLYWQALRPLTRDYASYVQLIGGPHGQNFAASNHQHPGNLPAHSWPTGQYVIDDHYVHIPPGSPPVPMRLQAGLYRQSTGERLGQVDLPDRAYVHARQPASAAGMPASRATRFGDGIRLLGQAAQIDREAATVTLYWQADRPPGADYQVFLQLLDNDGRPVAQADGSPMGGLYPTSLWQPGQIIADVHRVPVPPGHAVASAQVGLYRLDTVQRLPATRQDGTRWPDDAVNIAFEQPAAPR